MSYIGNTLQNQNYVPAIDYFSGDGATVAFTASRPIASVAQVQAVISNVPQNPGSAFTVSGSTITFTSAPPSGTNNIYVYYTSPNTSVATVSQSPTITGDLTTTGGQYTVGSFNSGYTDGMVQDYTTGTGRLTVGASDGFGVYNGGPASRSWLFGATSAGYFGIGTSTPTCLLEVYNSASTQYKFAQIGNQGPSVDSYGDLFEVWGDNSPSGNFTKIRCRNAMYLYTNATSLSGTPSLGIDTSGNLKVGTTVNLYARAGFANAGNCITTWNSGGTSGYFDNILFFNNAGVTSVGSIQRVNDSTVQYNTSSDYRLKENVQPMSGALDKVLQLNPVTYTWKVDGTDGQGFIAHELQAVVPDCVSGEKDAVDADGKPMYQGVDTSFLVATLTKAIQELKAELDELKAKVGA